MHLPVSALAAVSRLRRYRSFCDRLTQPSWPRATPLFIGNALHLLRTSGAVLPLPGNHSACGRSTPLCFLPRQVLQPSWPWRPPSFRMYSSAYSQNSSTRARCRKQRVRDPRVQPLLLLSRFSLQVLTLTPGPAPYCRREPSSAAEFVCCPPRQDRGGVFAVPLVGAGGC